MTTEQKALALVNAKIAEWGGRSMPLHIAEAAYGRCFEALCSAIEAHEADKKAFSDAVKRAVDAGVDEWVYDVLSPFILPEPEPDPLVEAVNEAWGWRKPPPDVTKKLRQALAARGYKIVPKEADNG